MEGEVLRTDALVTKCHISRSIKDIGKNTGNILGNSAQIVLT